MEEVAGMVEADMEGVTRAAIAAVEIVAVVAALAMAVVAWEAALSAAEGEMAGVVDAEGFRQVDEAEMRGAVKEAGMMAAAARVVAVREAVAAAAGSLEKEAARLVAMEVA